MAKELRRDQREGFVFEAYAEASSKVQALKRMATSMQFDEIRYPKLDGLYQKAKNFREQARTRLDPLEELDAFLYDPSQWSEEQRGKLIKDRDKLVGEIFIRLYWIDTEYRKSRGVLGG